MERKGEKSMINRIIDEINSALDHNLYFSALALALVLPDSCAKVEFPAVKSSKKRYKDWYKRYVGDSIFDANGLPNIDEDVAYSLRCSFLHEGNPNVEAKYGIDKFELMFQEKSILPDVEEIDDTTTIINVKYVDVFGTDNKTGERFYKVNVRSYCEHICECVSSYYNDNKSKFSFNYSIVNWEDIKP